MTTRRILALTTLLVIVGIVTKNWALMGYFSPLTSLLLVFLVVALPIAFLVVLMTRNGEWGRR